MTDRTLLLTLNDAVGPLFDDVLVEGSEAHVLVNRAGWKRVWEWLDAGPTNHDWVHSTYLHLENAGYDNMHLYSIKGNEGKGWKHACHLVHWPSNGEILIGPGSKPDHLIEVD